MARTPAERRAAQAAYQRRRYASDPDYRARQKQHSSDQWAALSPEERDARRRDGRERYAADPERREAVKARSLEAFHALTPDEKLERGRRNREREGAARRRERAKAEQARLRLEVLAAYGGTCECCGTTYEPHLTLDHIEGGGTVERRSEPGQMLFRRLRREGFPPGYRVLCWNCNWAAHRFGGRCPCQDSA